MFATLLKFNIALYIKNYSQAIYIYAFYVAVIAIFAFSGSSGEAGAQSHIIQALWVSGLLSVLFTSHMLLGAEEENGVLGLMPLWPIALEWLVLAKFLAIQLVVIAPLGLLSWAAASVLGLPEVVLQPVSILLWLGLTTVSAVTMLAASLTAGIARKGAIAGILVLPLMVPVMVFGSGASLSQTPWQHSGADMILGYCAIITPLSILISAAMLRFK
jgi:heme exporter protein B